MNPARHVRALISTWRGRFILVFVASQLLLPLRYYVAHRDPHDERFAWRMFSPMRMAHCSPKFALDGKPLELEATFHDAWIKLAERGRFVVIEAMADHVCKQHPGSSVTVSLDCTYLDRDPASYGGYDMCQVPLL
jgi:hypothetical protein